MKFNPLHNFISPITGKLPLDQNYILLGDKDGKSFSSPILLDIRQDIIDLRRNLNKADKLTKLDFNYIWIGDENNNPVQTKKINVINLPTLGAATFPYPSIISLPPVAIPNPTFNPLSGFDWLMSGPWLPQIYAGSTNITNTSSETTISSSLAMTQIKVAQAIKRLDITGFVVKNRNINFAWDNPAMLLIPNIIKELYGIETSYTFNNAQALDEIGSGILKNDNTGTLSLAISGKDYVNLAEPVDNMELVLIRPEMLEEGADVAKLLSRTQKLPIGNMPNLTNGKYWKGDENNNPVEVDLPTYAPKNASYILKTSNTELSNAQALNLIGTGLLKIAPLANGAISIASGGKVPTLDDYVTPNDLIEEITALETAIESQLTAITGYASLGLLTEFLVNIGWTTGYAEYLWSKYKPLRTENRYEDTDDYDKQAGNIWFDANHVGAAGNFKPGLRITSWDSSLTTASDLFPVSMGLFGYKNELGYVPAQEGFVWQSYIENSSSNTHYRFPKNFGLYYVGHDKGQIGWNRKEILLMEYKYYDEKFIWEKKVDFKENVRFLSTGAVKIPVGNNFERPSIVEIGMIRYNIEI